MVRKFLCRALDLGLSTKAEWDIMTYRLGACWMMVLVGIILHFYDAA